MGSTSSFNPCTYINSAIEKQIYYPPKNTKLRFEFMDHLIPLKTENNETIYLHICLGYCQTPEKYIIFSHGNGGDIVTTRNGMMILANMLGIGVIIYDYVGYGLSSGTPNETGCYQSLDAVMDYVLNTMRLREENIYLMGQSLGTGVVIDYLSRHNWNNPVILISPYKSICRIVADTSIVSPIDKFRSLDKLNKINCPIKIFHGIKDETINISHGKAIYQKLNNKALEPVWFENTNHQDIFQKITPQHYWEVLDYNTY